MLLEKDSNINHDETQGNSEVLYQYDGQTDRLQHVEQISSHKPTRAVCLHDIHSVNNGTFVFIINVVVDNIPLFISINHHVFYELLS